MATSSIGGWALPLLAVGCGLGMAGEPSAVAPASAQEESGPPPLVVDLDAPLLLEQGDETPLTVEADATLTESAPCFVCHQNYKSEPLFRGHLQARLDCIHCHGESFAHRNDENNTTPPDRMYAGAGINAVCWRCHPIHDVPAAKVVAAWLERYPEKQDTRTIVCTDCHGEHRLAHRTVRWDKKTGELLSKTKPSSGMN